MPDAVVLQAVWLSLTVAVVSSAAIFVPGLYVGWVLARSRSAATPVLHAVVMLPLVLPPVVTGYVLLVLFSPRGAVGHMLEHTLGIRIAFGWGGAVLAAAVVGFPLLVQHIRASIEAVDPRYEVLSRSLGHTPWDTFWRITFPLARPGMLAGVLLAFVRSLGEFGATITLAGYIEGETNTIPLTIFRALETPGSASTVMLLVMLSIAVAAAALGAYETLNRRHQTRLEWWGR